MFSMQKKLLNRSNVSVEHVQDASGFGMLVRQMRDEDQVFMGCNIQNPFVGVCVEKMIRVSTLSGQQICFPAEDGQRGSIRTENLSAESEH